MTLWNAITFEMLVAWGLSALGVYHILYVLGRTARRLRYRQGDIRDSGNQLRYVSGAQFSPRKVMNFSEYKVFRVVETEVQSLGRGQRVFAQTSLGEILQSPDRKAFASINSKRIDILVIHANGDPALVVEYQGEGHFQADAAARDAVKKEALRRAGVAYLEIEASLTEVQVRAAVRQKLELLSPHPQAARPPFAAMAKAG